MAETSVGLRFPRKTLLVAAVLAALFFAAFPVTAYYLVGGDGMTIEKSGVVGEQSLSLSSSHTFIIERYAGSVARASAVNFLISTLQIAVAASGLIGVLVLAFTKNMILALQASIIVIIAVAIINVFALFF